MTKKIIVSLLRSSSRPSSVRRVAIGAELVRLQVVALARKASGVSCVEPPRNRSKPFPARLSAPINLPKLSKPRSAPCWVEEMSDEAGFLFQWRHVCSVTYPPLNRYAVVVGACPSKFRIHARNTSLARTEGSGPGDVQMANLKIGIDRGPSSIWKQRFENPHGYHRDAYI